jgi:formylglycine-generating enzyme required for sulfatase activity
MGSIQDEKHAPKNEKPQHRVYLDEYWIGKYPVTVAQFAAYAWATGVKTEAELDIKGKADHPVTNLTWEEAMAFCEWAGRVTGREVRLPSEAQWEKAARGVDGRIYPWGSRFDQTRCNVDRYFGNTTPVGKFSPAGDSPYGCADLAGNVWEWCADWYGEEYYRASPAENPTGPASGEARVIRGGCFRNSRWDVRCARRAGYRPYHLLAARGFRVVVVSPIHSGL